MVEEENGRDNSVTLLQRHSTKNNIDAPEYESVEVEDGYICKLKYNNKSYQSLQCDNADKAKLAVAHDCLEKLQAEQDAVAGKPERERVTISTVEDCIKYMKESDFVSVFKSLLCEKATESGIYQPKYQTYEIEEDGITGWKGVVTYNKKQYDSNGLMANSRQAEQSASEVCMRHVAYLPYCSPDEMIVQPYKGGIQEMYFTSKMGARQKQSLMIFLNMFVMELGMTPIRLAIRKQMDPEIKETQRHQLYGVLQVADKTLSSNLYVLKPNDARMQITRRCLKYLGAVHFALIYDYRNSMKKLFEPKSNAPYPHPFELAPSVRQTWSKEITRASSGEMDGKTVSPEDLKKYFRCNSTPREMEKIMSEYLKLKPVYNHMLMGIEGAIDDLSVAEVINENLVVVGNQYFSIKMYCENKSLFCKNRSRAVTLLPGHQIRELVYSYGISFPDYQIYLKAEECTDLTYPNPALPVVTSCTAVVLLKDDKADSTEPYVLLKKQSDEFSFVYKAQELARYLNALLCNSDASTFDPNEFTEQISEWDLKHVQLMSEMSINSIPELLSQFLTYDDRWNELFVGDLPTDLLNLKELCKLEARKRAIAKKQHNKKRVEEKWNLPTFDFKSRFLSSIGPFVESCDMCLMRGMREEAGIGLSLRDCENCDRFDVPVEDKSNPHRGDVERCFIWTGIKGDGAVPAKELKDPSLLQKGEQFFTEDRDKGKEEGASTSSEVKTTPKPAAKPTEVDKSSKNDGAPSTLPTVIEECKWFTLREAARVCPAFKKVTEHEVYTATLTKLKEGTDTFSLPDKRPYEVLFAGEEQVKPKEEEPKKKQKAQPPKPKQQQDRRKNWQDNKKAQPPAKRAFNNALPHRMLPPGMHRPMRPMPGARPPMPGYHGGMPGPRGFRPPFGAGRFPPPPHMRR